MNRHPLAGVAAAYAGVSAAFAVNILIAPLDAMLTEVTNEAIAIVDPAQSITITANFFFSIASTLLMAVVMTFITARMVEPRLGVYRPVEGLGLAPGESADIVAPDDAPEVERRSGSARLERRALRRHWRGGRHPPAHVAVRRAAARSGDRATSSARPHSWTA